MVHGAIRAGRRVVGGQSRADAQNRQVGKGKRDSPLTTSLTHAASAKISRLYSGRLRVSILACAVLEPEAWAEVRVMRRAALAGDRVAARRSKAVDVDGAGVAIAVSWR